MLKDRIRNLFILISFMFIANGFIYYKTSSLDVRVLKMHALLLVAYLVWDFIFSKMKKGRLKWEIINLEIYLSY